MSADNKLSLREKIISVIAGAVLGGFLWRVRGTHGFGAMWGIIMFSSLFTLFIISYYGNRAKIKYELIPVGTLLAMLTVPAWGCVNTFMGGVLRGTVSGTDGEELSTVINGWHGLWILLMTGFTLLYLYSVFIGSLFSLKEYKFYHYLIIAGVFLIVVYAAKLSFAHNLLKLIIPEVGNSFADGIRSAGSDETVKQVYIHHILSTSALKKIPYGRAYGETIEHISYMCGALAVLLTALIAFRDKVTAFVSCLINLSTACAITVSDVFLINDKVNTGNIIKDITLLPGFLKVTSWSLWEFFTGFISGLLIMLIIAFLPEKLTAGRHYKSESMISNKHIRFIYHLILVFGLCVFAVPVRAFGLRLADTLEAKCIINESFNDTLSIIIAAALGVIIAVIMFIILKKNIINKNLPVPVKEKPKVFSRKILPVLVLVILVIFLIPDAETISDFSQIKSPSAMFDLLTGEGYIANTFAVISGLLCFIYFTIRSKRKGAHR